MRAKIKRHTTQWAEMKPDVYGGKSCDKVIPRWECQADGDHGGPDTEGTIRLAARTFPPGTTVTIEEPCCPDCGETREPVFPIPRRAPLYKGKCQCGFDWDAWVLNNYS